MLHNRQAPGRGFHEHFSLAPARSDTNPQSPTRQGSSSQCDVESTTPVTHPSHSPRPIPLAPSYPRPTPSPLPSSTSIERRLERRIRGREGHRQVSSWDARERPHLNHNATHPRPSSPVQPYVLSDQKP